MYKRIRQFLIVALLALVVIQFISIDKSNPDFNRANDFIEVTNTPFAIATKLKSACYDCHSNESTFPWYTNIQPVAWWIKGHVKVGRQNLNFSEWATYDQKRQITKLKR